MTDYKIHCVQRMRKIVNSNFLINSFNVTRVHV